MMNETEPFAPSVPAGQTSFMTTREVAETLEVDVDTINNTAKKLGFSDVLRKTSSKGGRPTKIFNAEQVTAIKEELMRHHNIKSEMPEKLQTELSIMHRVADGFAALKEWNTSLQQQLSEEKRKNEEMRPKAEFYDRLGISQTLFCFRDAARKCHIRQTDFMNLLKDKYIYEVRTSDGRHTYHYRAYAGFEKYFDFQMYEMQNGKYGQQLKLTVEGLDYFTRLINEQRGKDDGK